MIWSLMYLASYCFKQLTKLTSIMRFALCTGTGFRELSNQVAEQFRALGVGMSAKVSIYVVLFDFLNSILS